MQPPAMAGRRKGRVNRKGRECRRRLRQTPLFGSDLQRGRAKKRERGALDYAASRRHAEKGERGGRCEEAYIQNEEHSRRKEMPASTRLPKLGSQQ